MGYIASFIAWLTASFLPRLLPFIGSIVVQCLLTLGFSLVAVEGINIGLDFFVERIEDSFNGMPSDIIAIMGLLGLDDAVNIILTAYLFVLGLKGLSARKLIPSWRGTAK